MGENVFLDCVFGCIGSKDKLIHYLECPIILSIVNEAFSGLLAPQAFSRIGYVEPTALKFAQVACMFQAYHAVKIGMRCEVDKALQTRKFASIIHAASILARDCAQAHVSFAGTDTQSTRITHACTRPVRVTRSRSTGTQHDITHSEEISSSATQLSHSRRMSGTSNVGMHT